MKGTGYALVVISIFWWIIALLMKTTVSYSLDAVNNIGLMQTQTIHIYTSLVIFLAGIILIGFGSVCDFLGKKVTSPIQSETVQNLASEENYAVSEFKESFSSYTTEKLRKMQGKKAGSYSEEAMIAISEILKERGE